MIKVPIGEEHFHGYPYAQKLSAEIHKFNPDAKIQWYLTWGRPNGDEDRCEEIPQVCTYEGMQDAITSTYTTYGCMHQARGAARRQLSLSVRGLFRLVLRLLHRG